MKKKFESINNEYLKSIYKDKNFILSLKQPKNLIRELGSSIFISNFKKIRKPGTYKCSNKNEKYVKIIQMKPINLQCLMVKFGKSAEKLTATLPQCHILSEMWNV